MKKVLSILIIALSLQPAMANDSVNHSGQASKHSTLAGLESMETTVSVVSAVAAVPVVLSVAGGLAVANAVESAHKKLENSQRQPLVITKVVITADAAPDVAINEQTESQGEH